MPFETLVPADQVKLQRPELGCASRVETGNVPLLLAEVRHALERLVKSGTPHVIDLRNIGLIAGIELEGIPGQPTARAFEAFLRAYEKGVLIRTTGDTIALSPSFIIEKAQIDRLFETVREILKALP